MLHLATVAYARLDIQLLFERVNAALKVAAVIDVVAVAEERTFPSSFAVCLAAIRAAHVSRRLASGLAIDTH